MSDITSECQDVKNIKTEPLKYLSESPPKKNKQKKKNQWEVYDLSLKHSFKRPTKMLTSCRGKKCLKVVKITQLWFDLYTQLELPAFKNTLHTDKALLL